MGLPHAVIVTTADVTDRDGALQMIGQNLDNLLLQRTHGFLQTFRVEREGKSQASSEYCEPKIVRCIKLDGERSL